MAPLGLIATQLNEEFASPAALLAQPDPSILGRHLKARLEYENHGPRQEPLPDGVEYDFRPVLPKIGKPALALYLQRKAVQSYPLIYTTLALAHPN
jgi:hypothetical protein